MTTSITPSGCTCVIVGKFAPTLVLIAGATRSFCIPRWCIAYRGVSSLSLMSEASDLKTQESKESAECGGWDGGAT